MVQGHTYQGNSRKWPLLALDSIVYGGLTGEIFYYPPLAARGSFCKPLAALNTGWLERTS